MAFGFGEPIGVNILGGVKINAQENTATFGIGENFIQALSSQVKNNIVTGQTYGDFDFNNLQPIASPLYDPDGTDTFMPTSKPVFGLED